MMFKFLLAAALPALAAADTFQQVLTNPSNNLTLLASVLNNTDALATINNANNITLFAPNNDALTALMNSTHSDDPGAIEALIQYHIIPETVYSSQLKNGSQFVPTTLTNSSWANVTGGQVVEIIKVNNTVSLVSGLLQNSTVVAANLNFTGGTIHVINKVLTVPTNFSTALQDASLSAAWGALNATGLLPVAEGLRDVTFFVPNNAAFEAVGSIFANASIDTLKDVLTYHVVNGSKPLYSTDLTNTTLTTLEGNQLTVIIENGAVFVNSAKVVTPDLLIAGGVIHVIDEILNPSNTTAKPSGTKGVPAFSGASSITALPFTSGVPAPAQTTGGGAPAVQSSSTSTSTGAAPKATAFGFGAAAAAAAVALLI